MSGETEKDVSGWTVDTALAYLERQILDLRAMLDERYATQTKAVEAAFQVQQVAVERALAAAEKAVDLRQDASDREFHEHLEQVRHENYLAQIGSDKAVTAAMAAQEKAVSKAEASVDRRLESMNEFRQQLADQASTFISRKEDDARQAEAHARLDALTERLTLESHRVNERLAEIENRLTSRLDHMSGQQQGATNNVTQRQDQVRLVVAIVSVVLVAVSVAVAIILGFNQ